MERIIKRLALFGLLVLVGCGGDDSAGSGNQTTIKLINSQSGKPLSDGQVEAFVLTFDFAPSLDESGQCCTIASSRNHITLGKGFVGNGGTFSFSADESKMPKTDNLINYDFSNAPPEMDTPEESERILLTLLSLFEPLGYYVSGDGPGFFGKTQPVGRDTFLGSATITFPLNPI